MDGVNRSDVEAVLALYDKDAILIPTFCNRILDTPKELREYFERLGAYEDLRVTLRENTLSIQNPDGPVSILSGIYKWRLKVDGDFLCFEARFSFGLQLANQAPVLHHHSSQIPHGLDKLYKDQG